MVSKLRSVSVVIATGLLLHIGVLSAQPLPVEKIAVGAIFDQNTEEIQNVFKYAMTIHNQNITSRRLELQAYVDVINTADAFKLSRLICNQFARGVFGMLGAVTPESFDTLHSYTNTFQMPFVTPWFPEKVIPPSSGLIDHAVSLRPDYHKAIVDTIVYYGWKDIIYMYDSHDGTGNSKLYSSFATTFTSLFDFRQSGQKLLQMCCNISPLKEYVELPVTCYIHSDPLVRRVSAQIYKCI